MHTTTCIGASPLISVIVPVYNTASWLRRCLDSICSQSYQNLEILCVNDGSTDNSAEILVEYAAKDSRIKVFTQENAGLSAARNTALDHATGEWVTGVDSDDWLEIEAYEQAMRSTADGVDMVWFGTQIEGEKPAVEYAGLAEYYRVKLEGVHELSEEVCRLINVNFWNKLYRRELIERYNLRFPEGLLYEDIPFFHGYASVAAKVACVPGRYYHYLQRSSSIMGQSMQKTPRSVEHIQVLAYLVDFWEKHGIAKKMQSRLIYLLNRYYWAAVIYSTVEMLPVLHREAYLLSRKQKVFRLLHSRIRRIMLHGVSPAWVRFFLYRGAHRWSLGLGTLHLITVVYSEHEVTYWFLGRCVLKKTSGEQST